MKDGLLAKAFANGFAQAVVEFVGFFQEFLADTVVVAALVAFRREDFVPHGIEKVDGFVDEARHGICLGVRVGGKEQGAIIHECSDDVFQVLLDVSKIHSVLN